MMNLPRSGSGRTRKQPHVRVREEGHVVWPALAGERMRRGRGRVPKLIDERHVLLFLGILNRPMIQFRLPIGRILLFLSFGLIFPSRGLPAREGGRERKPGLRTETWGWDVGGDRQKKKKVSDDLDG